MKTQKNNKKPKMLKEKIIMIASSAFVMTALTVSGLYMKDKDTEKHEDNGYSIDLSQIEPAPESSPQELAFLTPSENVEQAPISEDALDYAPVEPEETEGNVPEESVAEPEPVNGGDVVIGQTLNFTAEEGLVMPTEGFVLMHYNMDNTVYFATLDQYKYNPAVIISAPEGEPVYACADGEVVSVFSNEEIGQSMILDLGNGYQVTYGQLQNLSCEVGDFVSAGEKIAEISAPTKYYSVEGSNLYFSMSANGELINPEEMLGE
ncbi:MAG: M23 family metallopeptidase [Lachnospiraceae bacterium]|nr:M23 family metallopeptidase [Lachnospiraceae bacterium]